MKEAVAIQVGLKGPADVREAEEMAGMVDNILFEHRNNRGHLPASRNTYRTPGGPTPMELDNIRRTTLTDKDRERLLKEGKCFFCQEGKHLAKDCPEKRKRRGVNAIEEVEDSGKEDSPPE